MSNQILNISPGNHNILGIFREDAVIVICDTASGEFSSVMPEGFLIKCHTVIFYNIGSNDFTLVFQSKSMLYFYNGYVSNIVIGAGNSVEMFNEPVSGKWRKITGSMARFIRMENGTLVLKADTDGN
jgi:hypothetical protein